MYIAQNIEIFFLSVSLLSHTFTQSNIVYTQTHSLSLNLHTHRLHTLPFLLLPLSLFSPGRVGRRGGGRERERERERDPHIYTLQSPIVSVGETVCH